MENIGQNYKKTRKSLKIQGFLMKKKKEKELNGTCIFITCILQYG